MTERFSEMLMTGGHTNSLGRNPEVIQIVLGDRSRLPELYDCLFHEDAWVRMRAADALEKVCREHRDWLLPYIDKFADSLHASTQPSIQWHLAQMYEQVELTDVQRRVVLSWLTALLSSKEVDWIVAANAMDALAKFTQEGHFPVGELAKLLKIQQHHKSNAVIKRAVKHLAMLETYQEASS